MTRRHTSPSRRGMELLRRSGKTPAERNQDLRIIFLAMLSASRASFCGMIGLELQPGRDSDGPRTPGSHFVTGCAAISYAKRAASSSRVSPINSRLFCFRCRGYGAFLSELIESFLLMPVLTPILARGSAASRLTLPGQFANEGKQEHLQVEASSGPERSSDTDRVLDVRRHARAAHLIPLSRTAS